MAREYIKENAKLQLELKRYNITVIAFALSFASLSISALPISANLSPFAFFLLCAALPCTAIFLAAASMSYHNWMETERSKESKRRGGKAVLGMPPQRNAFVDAIRETKEKGKLMIDRYLVGFELDGGQPIWVSDDELCSHGCVFAKTGVGKTLWLEGLMFQQMARGRASGFTFIDAKRDPGTLADIIMMALITGRIEDLIVIDPFDPVCAYNFVFTTQRPDVKARKVLRCGLPPTSDQSTTKHYDRLAADAVYRVVRCMESLGLAWSVRDIAVAMSAFNFAYPRMRDLLHEQGAKQAMVELGHLASSYRTAKGSLDSARLTDNLRGIASELHSISNSEAGEMFCAPRADLSLTDAILRGKFIYYMLPRLEEAESAARMVKVFREDLEVSIGEITSSRSHRLEDPHMVIIDEGASTFGPTWANLFELARKGRFALLFGAQSVGGLMDEQMGLSEQFYERVIANVNLKVIMRIGDNRTAEDMCEWIGKVTTTKKSLATGVSTSLNAREFTKHIEINKRTADGFREAVTVSEDEEDLVSAEELKHEMSAEKGLAWFDKGDGRLRKGRAIWFESDLPATWEGREFLTRYETVEADEIGLAEWVDEYILSIERAESERKQDGGSSYDGGPSAPSTPFSVGSSPDSAKSSGTSTPTTEEKPDDGPFRFNLLKGMRGKPRARTFVGPGDEKKSDDAEQTPETQHNTAVNTESAKAKAPVTEESIKNAAPSSESSLPEKSTPAIAQRSSEKSVSSEPIKPPTKPAREPLSFKSNAPAEAVAASSTPRTPQNNNGVALNTTGEKPPAKLSPESRAQEGTTPQKQLAPQGNGTPPKGEVAAPKKPSMPAGKSALPGNRVPNAKPNSGPAKSGEKGTSNAGGNNPRSAENTSKPQPQKAGVEGKEELPKERPTPSTPARETQERPAVRPAGGKLALRGKGKDTVATGNKLH